MEYQNLIACRECDLLFRKPSRVRGQVACCSRCGASLKGKRDAGLPLDWICAVNVAALITFFIAQAFPVIDLKANGMVSEATLFGAVRSLWTGDMRLVAMMVFCSSILVPLIELLAFLYVLVAVRTGRLPPHFNWMLRLVQLVRPWGMVEVFMLGVLVTIVKMVSIAQVVPGPGLFAFGALTLMLGVLAAFDPSGLWEIRDEMKLRRAGGVRWARVSHRRAVLSRVPGARKSRSTAHTTAQRAGLIACHTCGLVQKRIRHQPHQHCPRCESVLHERHPDSVTRTFSLLLAAALAYVPANLLPIMHASSLGRSEDDTILGGVAYFWTSGDWPLAVVVFVASVVVPMLKLAALTLQTAAVRRSSAWQPRERARLHRLVERVGRWSMLDVFVVALTVTLVHFGSFAVITAGPGALAFGAVVILTMLASHQFDPRLIWDNVRF
ncbi:PqiA/YebS family transporter subunit [Paraburkholderia panacisoli]|uniref:PqiA/YebS family transporter subunit n=1 Tax=Paraburkholderia panacisoli TaxID=2603818 RepID=A0A5B0G5I2_9BURK|nr:PqiA/YebS family transporter subunit [Paraburkholderia panacisoli]KAA0998803.1 PqiA/YebS family transporter subunit [Paraburkholderia panacisoli]